MRNVNLGASERIIDIQKQDFYFSSFIIKLNTITKFSHDILVYDLFSFRMNFTEFPR